MKTKNQIKTEAARELRRKQTGAEFVLWEILKNRRLGFKFRRQHVIRGFIIDFYCPEKHLGIEVDGSVHYQQIDYDHARQNVLKDLGIKILHFKNLEIIYNIENVIKRIEKALHNRVRKPFPPNPYTARIFSVLTKAYNNIP